MRSPIASHFHSDAIPPSQHTRFRSQFLTFRRSDVQTLGRSDVLTIPISPLESVLTKIPSVTSLESALTQKCRGVASRMVLRDHPRYTHSQKENPMKAKSAKPSSINEHRRCQRR